ncbi:Rv3235 family protein [Mycobacterium parmense]|uniref:Uncharacterized protein n=1 Tax=Mycobacterium parmense TaxID=185642 RepID=A0A7I7YXS7_9MYCO|nr:Rv3235 family protein [Mycobacterium parmense]MCV7351020.1 hypothetical protein [Mycobacterium parmense]ORW60597.1 hypothetical protein AWC20_06350 [Mycobacterium parmense]BBZ45541.1 hypothetical protein MPRM_28220 [Mycobacterium parmense]
MTADPASSPPPGDAFSVTRVVDYEPPAGDVSHGQPSHPPLRRPYGGRPGKRTTPPEAGAGKVAPMAMPAPMRQAAAFADAALRRILEVIDRRRPAAQLRPMLAPGLVDSVVSVGRSGHPGPQRGAAVLRRMRLQPAGHRDVLAAAEVFGSYSRGNRMHAIACRVERVGDETGGNRWQVVALHIG